MHQYKISFLRLRSHRFLTYLQKIFYFNIFFFICATLSAQEEFVPPPAKYITTIPFTQLTGGIVILRATFDDFKDSLNFVLDTGSGGISIDSSTCDYFKLKTVPSDRIVR